MKGEDSQVANAAMLATVLLLILIAGIIANI